MGFLFSKKAPRIDETLLPRVTELARTVGEALNIALGEINGRRPFACICVQRESPRVQFLTAEQAESFAPAEGPWAICAVKNAQLSVTANDADLQLLAAVDVDEQENFFFLSDDFGLKGSAVRPEFHDVLQATFEAECGNTTLPSLLELPCAKELVERAERKLWNRTLPLRGLNVFIDQDSGAAVLTDNAREVMRCSFTVLGTWSVSSESWLWGWANPSVDPKYTERLKALRESVFKDERMFAPFQPDGVRIAAVAAEQINADFVALLPLSPTSIGFYALFTTRN